MAAFIALGKAVGENVADTISSFLYRSCTEAATCSGESNIADLTDDVLAAENRNHRLDPVCWLYAENMEFGGAATLTYI